MEQLIGKINHTNVRETWQPIADCGTLKTILWIVTFTWFYLSACSDNLSIHLTLSPSIQLRCKPMATLLFFTHDHIFDIKAELFHRHPSDNEVFVEECENNYEPTNLWWDQLIKAPYFWKLLEIHHFKYYWWYRHYHTHRFNFASFFWFGCGRFCLLKNKTGCSSTWYFIRSRPLDIAERANMCIRLMTMSGAMVSENMVILLKQWNWLQFLFLSSLV